MNDDDDEDDDDDDNDDDDDEQTGNELSRKPYSGLCCVSSSTSK